MPAAHLAWPLALNPDGTFASVAQRSAAELAQRVAVLLEIKPGDLVDEPALGRPPKTKDGLNVDALRDYVREFEPDVPIPIIDSVIADRAQTIDIPVAA